MSVEPHVYAVAEYREIDLDIGESTARQLQAAGGARITVTPAARGFRVRASSHVGSIAVPGLIIHVVPKVPIDNVLLLLTWSTRRISLDPRLAGHALGDLTSATAVWFARMLEQTLVLGVGRSYVEESDRLVAVRGRLDMAAQSRSSGLPMPVACQYDEWSVDTRVNRLVVAAANVLIRNPGIAAETTFTLRRLLKPLSGVGPLRPEDVSSSVPLTNRLNEHYASVAQLARLILSASGPAENAGRTRVSAFLVDMNAVFEDFVLGSLRHQLRGVWNVVGQRSLTLGARGEVPGRPDLMFEDRSGAPGLVADTKYKLTTDGHGRSADYYQLLAYCTALDLPRGMLIYADTDGEPSPPRRVIARHAGTVLDTFRVRLTGSADDLALEMRRLATACSDPLNASN